MSCSANRRSWSTFNTRSVRWCTSVQSLSDCVAEVLFTCVGFHHPHMLLASWGSCLVHFKWTTHQVKQPKASSIFGKNVFVMPDISQIARMHLRTGTRVISVLTGRFSCWTVDDRPVRTEITFVARFCCWKTRWLIDGIFSSFATNWLRW